MDEYISSFVDFYCHQIVADNHAVREAACACIAELAQKCSADALAKGISLKNSNLFVLIYILFCRTHSNGTYRNEK